MNCRLCSATLSKTILDLGFAPPSNSYLSKSDLSRPEAYFPLRIKLCTNCWLVQTEDFASNKELFNSEYAYLSSTSLSWMNHAENFAKKIIKTLKLTKESYVVEIACNDGYLLKNFIHNEIPCLGIEPTKSTASIAESHGISVIKEFFGKQIGIELANSGKKADLIIGNNVYAHVPDIKDFTEGMKILLKQNGTISLEFPHLLNLIKHNQFDTIYHEHYSYLSLNIVNKLFNLYELKIFDVEKLSTHGGSLRIYGCHKTDDRIRSYKVDEILVEEKEYGLENELCYGSIQINANKIKNKFLEFLLLQKNLKNKVAAYGAAAKGNTLINYAGVKSDLLECVYDAAESKQNKYLPGSHIPIYHPDMIYENIPKFLIILPWNIAEEIRNQNKKFENYGTKFVVTFPSLIYLN